MGTRTGAAICLLVFAIQPCIENAAYSREGNDSCGGGDVEMDAIQDTIEQAYIVGIHTTQDELKVARGFHPDFAMLVQRGDGVTKVTTGEWLANIRRWARQDPSAEKVDTTCQFELIDHTENAAVVKLRVFKNSREFSVDYMLLYKYRDGWKIVSKIFTMR